MNTKYHTYNNHIKPMLTFIDENLHLNGINGESKKRVLKLAAIFHDIVYVPGNTDNEDKSIEVFKQWCELNYNEDNTWLKGTNVNALYYEEKFMEYAFKTTTDEEKEKVIELIENTKNPFDMRYGDELGHYFAKLDVYGLTQDYYTLQLNEHRIYNEFKNRYTLKEYKEGRVKFLNEAIEKIPNVNKPGIEKLINYVLNRSYGNVGIFAGSFNPFTKGHYDILGQAIYDFEKVYVVRLQNTDKPVSEYPLPEFSFDNVTSLTSDKMLHEVFEELSYGYNNGAVIRALRNGDDLQYEQNLKAVVRDLTNDIRFVYYLAHPEYQHISSSMVRSLPEQYRDKYIIKG